jgi:hypothetical protein
MPLASLMLGVCEEVGCGACDETVMIDGRFMRLVCQLLLSRYALATVVAHIDCSRCAHVVERSKSRRIARAWRRRRSGSRLDIGGPWPPLDFLAQRPMMSSRSSVAFSMSISITCV